MKPFKTVYHHIRLKHPEEYASTYSTMAQGGIPQGGEATAPLMSLQTELTQQIAELHQAVEEIGQPVHGFCNGDSCQPCQAQYTAVFKKASQMAFTTVMQELDAAALHAGLGEERDKLFYAVQAYRQQFPDGSTVTTDIEPAPIPDDIQVAI